MTTPLNGILGSAGSGIPSEISYNPNESDGVLLRASATAIDGYTTGPTDSEWYQEARNSTDSGKAILDLYCEEANFSLANLQVIDATGAVTTKFEVRASGEAIVYTSLAAPVANDTAGPKGTITYDANYLYIWIDADTPKKVALAAIVGA